MIYTIDNPLNIAHSYIKLAGSNSQFTGVAKTSIGDIAYYENGFLHREDGPALISASGFIIYLTHGKYNRLDGPAVIYSNGIKEYWIAQSSVSVSSDEEFERYIKLRMFE